MMSAVVRADQRWTQGDPCPVCGGWQAMARGALRRCYGFASHDGRYARCARGEYAGALMPNRDGLFAHFLGGPCRCGVDHRDDRPVLSRRPASSAKGANPANDADVLALRICGVTARCDSIVSRPQATKCPLSAGSSLLRWFP